MNENEVKNNTNENNVVTPVEPTVSEKTVTASTPEVTQINEPEMVPSELDVTTPAADATPVVETPVIQETVVSETTPAVETAPVVDNVPLAEVTESPVVSTPAEAVSVEEKPVEPQVNVSAGAVNAINGETNKKKSNKGIIIIAVLLVAVLLVVVGFVLNGQEEKSSTEGPENNNGEVDKPAEKPNDNTTVNGTLIEDVTISGYMCMGEKCTISVRLKDEVNDVDYNYNGPNVELVKALSDYSAYVKVNIYVTGEGENITIVNYELFNRSTNAKIDGVTTEAELRTVLGMYNIGTHTAKFTLVEIGTVGYGFGDNQESYTYRDYNLVDEKGFEYEMQYINPGKELDALVEGNKYTVTFEVVKGTFDYEYTIKEIK